MLDDDKTAWWRQPWPWFLMSLPMAAIIGGVITAWLATRDADSLVSDDYYKEGLAIRQVLDRDAKAKALGVAATLDVQGGRLSVALSGNVGKVSGLRLHLIHPTRAEQDLSVNLPAAPGRPFAADLPPLQAGKRQLVLEPNDRSWRLTGEWFGPFVGQLTLRP